MWHRAVHDWFWILRNAIGGFVQKLRCEALRRQVGVRCIRFADGVSACGGGEGGALQLATARTARAVL